MTGTAVIATWFEFVSEVFPVTVFTVPLVTTAEKTLATALVKPSTAVTAVVDTFVSEFVVLLAVVVGDVVDAIVDEVVGALVFVVALLSVGDKLDVVTVVDDVAKLSFRLSVSLTVTVAVALV